MSRVSLRAISSAVARLVTRGRVVLADDTATPHQRLQVRGLAGEVLSDVQRPQPAGLATLPRADAEVLLLEVGAAHDHVIAILAPDDASRPKDLVPGETVVHGEGAVKIRLKPSGDLEIDNGSGAVVQVTAAGDVNVNGGDVVIDGGNVSVTGSQVTIDGSTEIDGKSFLNHTHSPGGYTDSLSAPVTGVSGSVV